MKKFIAILAICGLFFTGCAAFKTDVAKVEADIKAVDWSAVQTYWADFVRGLEAAVPVVEAIFPGSKSTVDKVVTPVLADANTAVTALTTTVQAYQAGTLTSADATAAAKETQAAVVAASNVIGQALKGKLGVAAQAAATAVPTSPATPAGSSK